MHGTMNIKTTQDVELPIILDNYIINIITTNPLIQ
jgi:hypothetical protein